VKGFTVAAQDHVSGARGGGAARVARASPHSGLLCLDARTEQRRGGETDEADMHPRPSSSVIHGSYTSSLMDRVNVARLQLLARVLALGA
jgi:hypothetical protein